MAVIDTFQRATGIVEKELDNGASMVQLKKAATVNEALSLMVKAKRQSFADSKSWRLLSNVHLAGALPLREFTKEPFAEGFLAFYMGLVDVMLQ